MDEQWITTINSLRQGSIAPFWMNVLAASNLDLAPGVADRPRITPEGVAARLATKPRWLTPFTVAGFRPNEFHFLSQAEFNRLSDGVSGVQAVTSELRPDQAASDEQRERALPHFLAILEVLEFDRYGDVPALILGKQIEQALAPNWPPHLDHLRFRTGFDSTEDPALWAWGYVAQTGEYDETTFLEWASDIRRVVDPICREFAPDRRAFLYFRSTAEQLELEGVAA